MFSAKRHPGNLSPELLDVYLERGWFRMNQSIFITHFLHFEAHFFPAIWLRYPLDQGIGEVIDKKLRPIEKKFRIEITPWVLTDEQEALFNLYRAHAGLDMAVSLRELLLGQWAGDGVENIFNTYQVCMYDGTKPVAFGFFDVGSDSAAGISSIYHPDYRKYSLGKALMYAKMKYCSQRKIRWFYPGYAVPGHKRFNYKLDIAPGHTEYFCPKQEGWLPHLPAQPLPDYLAGMERKLSLLQETLAGNGLPSTLVHYRQFDAALMDLDYSDLLNFPIFLHCAFDKETRQWLVVVYDIIKGSYRLLLCNTLVSFGSYRVHQKVICTDLLQEAEALCESSEPQALISFLSVITAFE
jgi:leucyl-tRNA---protein transferase